MSKGTPITPIRIPRDLLEQIDQAIAASHEREAREPHTRTSWILSAIREKLKHQERGRRPRRSAVARPADELARACERGRRRAEATDKKGAEDGN